MAGKVTIKTTDPKVSKLVEQIDKPSLLWVWIAKAAVLLDQYLSTLNGLTPTTDGIEAGKKIQECECYIMSSVTLYLRCFLEQQATHLQIDDITKDTRLTACHRDMLQLRHDEFVHWKGLRSSTQARYTLVRFESNRVEFDDSMKELFRLAGDYTVRRRVQILRKLESMLSAKDALVATQVLDESGNQVTPDLSRPSP